MKERHSAVVLGMVCAIVGCSSGAGTSDGGPDANTNDSGLEASVDTGTDSPTPTPIATGVIDTTFGASNGHVLVTGTAGGTEDVGNAIAIDSAGNILVAGYSMTPASKQEMALWRFTPTGAVDAAFGSNGHVVAAGVAGGTQDVGSGIAIDSSGNILVAGFSANAGGTGTDMVLWRYTSTGAVDANFGGSGHVVATGTAGGTKDFGSAIAIDSAGKILVTGFSSTAGNTAFSMALWRFSSTGTADATFGSNGHVLAASTAGGIQDNGTAVAVDSAGKILVAGYSYASAGVADMALWRFTSAGAVDTTFGSNGHVLTASTAGGTQDFARAISIDSAGNIVVGGVSLAAGNTRVDMALWRYTSTGAVDTTFGNNNGHVLATATAGGLGDAGTGGDYGSGIALDSAGNVLVAGESDFAAGADMALWRYTPTGAADTAFGSNGHALTTGTAGGAGDVGNAIAIDSAGKILVAGYSYAAANGVVDMALWRFK